jgi:hypothetical protein
LYSAATASIVAANRALDLGDATAELGVEKASAYPEVMQKDPKCPRE